MPKNRFHNQEGLFSSEELHPYTELDAARNKALKCTKCPLAEARLNVVFGTGKKDRPILMVIGEAPGGHDDSSGVPFTGPAGKVLDRFLKTMEITRKDVYLANIVQCRPPLNRAPTIPETMACSEFIARQIRCVNPQILVALGSTAASTLLGKYGKDLETDETIYKPVNSMRGRWYQWEEIPLRVTYHPSFLLIANEIDKNRAKPEILEDLKMIQAKMYTLTHGPSSPANS